MTQDTIDITITTPARRLARTVNANPSATSDWYDLEGRELHDWSDAVEYRGSLVPAKAVLRLSGRNGGERMTYREAAILLEAARRFGRFPRATMWGENFVASLLRGEDPVIVEPMSEAEDAAMWDELESVWNAQYEAWDSASELEG